MAGGSDTGAVVAGGRPEKSAPETYASILFDMVEWDYLLVAAYQRLLALDRREMTAEELEQCIEFVLPALSTLVAVLSAYGLGAGGPTGDLRDSLRDSGLSRRANVGGLERITAGPFSTREKPRSQAALS
jgi:hypothetical protein